MILLNFDTENQKIQKYRVKKENQKSKLQIPCRVWFDDVNRWDGMGAEGKVDDRESYWRRRLKSVITDAGQLTENGAESRRTHGLSALVFQKCYNGHGSTDGTQARTIGAGNLKVHWRYTATDNRRWQHKSATMGTGRVCQLKLRVVDWVVDWPRN